MGICQPININSINNTKKTIKIKANDEDLIYLAKETNTLKFLKLEGLIEIKRDINRFIVLGNIIADIVQACSLNLEEVNTHLNLPIKRIYEKEPKISSKKKVKEILINLDKEEDIDILEKDIIDINFIILEELILNINPFIKKEE